MEKKKVISLYRVSTKRQVDKVKREDSALDGYDIPMQKKACREFISNNPGWELYRELSEFGVSGYKVSVKERDAVQEIQKEALAGNFDVLLVFMFDRLGRIDDETPFVVEWFVQHGIEVWSVKEGEQRFENHVDKLTNYIRFWQASGESEKTSIRTKESLAQMVKEKRFRGGVAPFGYRLEKRGRQNKRGHEVNEIEIDKDEAAIVRLIFELYGVKGYGSQRISSYLTEKGISNRKGENFTNGTINNMISNRAYMGVLRSGETESEIFPDLQIVSPEVFEDVQFLKSQRASMKNETRRVPLNTKGSSLLSGNVFCGHCGARLTVTTNKKKYTRKDGTTTKQVRTRYVCYNKTRHKHKCDGQTGYTTAKLDRVIGEIARSLFLRFSDLPKEIVVKERYAERIKEFQIALAQAKAAHRADMAEMKEYETEVLKIIRGESKLDAELLNQLYDEAKEKTSESKNRVKAIEETLKDSEILKESLTFQFDEIRNWADMYDVCDMETKKMIVSRLFSSIKVRRDYEIEIVLTASCEQLGIELNEFEDCDKRAMVFTLAS